MKFGKILAFAALAAGVGVAYMATREDGRKVLSSWGEDIKNGYQTAKQLVESYQEKELAQFSELTNHFQRNSNHAETEMSHSL